MLDGQTDFKLRDGWNDLEHGVRKILPHSSMSKYKYPSIAWGSRPPVLPVWFLSNTPRRRSSGPLPVYVRYVLLCSFSLFCVFILVLVTSLFNAFFRPIYTTQPPHYNALQHHIFSSQQYGRGNIHNEKVFIAANIVDAELINGTWGQSLTNLITLLGPYNVFLSIYENDSGSQTAVALRELEYKQLCNTSIVAGAHINIEELHPVTLPDGSQSPKRIEYLAKARNHALRPLDPPEKRTQAAINEGVKYTDTVFDKVLFLNDVFFDPVEAIQLLFSTNQDPASGRARYQAACAVDFGPATSYRDSYASRDFDGYGLGCCSGKYRFPWFSSIGSATSRKDVLAGTDAVRVKACWGGMVAFQANWFQQSSPSRKESDQSPIRFRHDPGLWTDASECCLVHADIEQAYLNIPRRLRDNEKIIVQNPFVRTAYSLGDFQQLTRLRRHEHGWSLLQSWLTWVHRFPKWRGRAPAIDVKEEESLWWAQYGSDPSIDHRTAYEFVEGPANVTSLTSAHNFCRVPGMQILKPNVHQALTDGELIYYDAGTGIG